MKFAYLSKKWKRWKNYVKYDIVFLKYTQISISLICFSCGKVEYITYKFNISVFQRKYSTSKNSKIEKYMFFDNDNIKYKDKK